MTRELWLRFLYSFALAERLGDAADDVRELGRLFGMPNIPDGDFDAWIEWLQKLGIENGLWGAKPDVAVPPFELPRVSSIVLVRRRAGPDMIALTLDIPDGIESSAGLASADIRVARGSGEAYCAAYFRGVPVEVVDVNVLQGRGEA